MTENNDYIDWDEVAQKKPVGLWVLQAYFLVRSGMFAYLAAIFFANSASLPLGFWLLPTMSAVLYGVGVAGAQGRWRYSRAICVALMLFTLVMEVLRHWIPDGPAPTDQFKFQLDNQGERLGAQLAQIYGPAMQLLLLLYLLFSRHVREFVKRRQAAATPLAH